MRYETLAALKAAYDSGELDRDSKLMIDNDDTNVWDGMNHEAFRMHPDEVLVQALDLLGIPHDYV